MWKDRSIARGFVSIIFVTAAFHSLPTLASTEGSYWGHEAESNFPANGNYCDNVMAAYGYGNNHYRLPSDYGRPMPNPGRNRFYPNYGRGKPSPDRNRFYPNRGSRNKYYY